MVAGREVDLLLAVLVGALRGDRALFPEVLAQALGTLRHLLDGSYLSGETVRVSLYDPTNFLGNPTPTALAATGRLRVEPAPGRQRMHWSQSWPVVLRRTGAEFELARAGCDVVCVPSSVLPTTEISGMV